MVNVSRLNSILLMLIIVINAYIVITPFTPQMWFWWQSHHSSRAAQLSQAIQHPKKSAANKPAPSPSNAVIVPAMLLDQPIFEGSNKNAYSVLNKGIWRWPSSSTPDKGGNTVLIGHRFTYTTPRGVFYFLDKLRVGDSIGVTWDNQHYIYRVVNIAVVPPTQTSILDQTTEPTLTLYTCTPLWWPKDRLVVTAHLESKL